MAKEERRSTPRTFMKRHMKSSSLVDFVKSFARTLRTALLKAMSAGNASMRLLLRGDRARIVREPLHGRQGRRARGHGHSIPRVKIAEPGDLKEERVVPMELGK